MKTETNKRYIEEFLKYTKGDKGCRPNTIDSYRTDLNMFMNHFKDFDILHLTELQIREYKYHLVDLNLKPRTINHKLIVISCIYEYFINKEDSTIYKNPTKNIQKMKVPKKIPITINANQGDSFLSNILLKGSYAIRDYAMFSTFMFTGARASEIINLQIHDIDFDNNLIFFRDAKGAKDRAVPMDKRLIESLKIYLENDTVYDNKKEKGTKIVKYKSGRNYFVKDPHDKTLFLTKFGSKFTDSGITYHFKNYTKAINIYKPGLSLHALRRSCLTWLHDEGVDVFTLKEISGHSDIRTLEHYLAIKIDKVTEAIGKHPLADRGMDVKLLNLYRDF